MNKAYITGIGCISSIGNNFHEFSDAILKGTNGVKPITRFDTSNFSAKVAAEVSNYDASKHFNSTELNLLDRHTQYALLSSEEAINDSGLEFTDSLAQRTAVILGTGIGGQETLNDGYNSILRENHNRVHPFTVPKLIPCAAVSHISIKYGIKGPSFATTSACSSSGHAIGVALMMIRAGMADVVITGGSEAPVCFGSFLAWQGLRVLTKDLCRPFSMSRGGMALGEGAATLIIESEQHAIARGAKIYAELAGCGMSSDAFHIVQPNVEGPEAAMRMAIKDAQLNNSDISYINAHGSGTAKNDPVESQAIKNIFGGAAKNLAVSSTKSMHGHLLGAASALELIASIVALNKQVAPPTINYLGPDPACDLDYVPNQAREMPINSVLSSSFAFGGLNAVLALKKSLL